MMTVRSPRCWLLINGAKVPCQTAKVTRKSERKADTFQAVISINASTLAGGPDLAGWADYQPSDVSLVFSTQPNGGDEQTMITGQVDEPEIDWLKMEVTVSGRDKSASLMEKRRSQKFQNQKSSDVVSTIAKDHGLTAQVVATDDDAGLIYDQDLASLALNRTDYEIVADLAEREGYRFYVDGSMLYYEPTEQESDVYTVTWVPPQDGNPAFASVLSLKTHRNMSAARKHKHHGKSWHHRDKKLYSATETLDGVGDEIEYHHHHNGRRQDQLEKLAKTQLKNATRHELGVSITTYGDLSADVRMKLQLVGTGTIYDQTYDIDTIEFGMAWEGGFTMALEAKSAKAGRS